MNQYGRAARFAYNPLDVLAYVVCLETVGARTSGYTDDTTGRTIRRWRGAKGVTRPALVKVLRCYNRSEGDFLAWAKSQDREVVTRNRR